jgi:hypothetical protein
MGEVEQPWAMANLEGRVAVVTGGASQHVTRPAPRKLTFTGSSATWGGRGRPASYPGRHWFVHASRLALLTARRVYMSHAHHGRDSVQTSRGGRLALLTARRVYMSHAHHGRDSVQTSRGGNSTARSVNKLGVAGSTSSPASAPTATSDREGVLEHPAEAFEAFRRDGVPRVICEERHMGSGAVVIACRDEAVGDRRFGVAPATPESRAVEAPGRQPISPQPCRNPASVPASGPPGRRLPSRVDP